MYTNPGKYFQFSYIRHQFNSLTADGNFKEHKMTVKRLYGAYTYSVGSRDCLEGRWFTSLLTLFFSGCEIKEKFV